MLLLTYSIWRLFSPHVQYIEAIIINICTVLDPSKGVCADPVGRAAILEVKGLGPPVGVSEHQLSPDRRGEKT
jgi:hypothetical protein